MLAKPAPRPPLTGVLTPVWPILRVARNTPIRPAKVPRYFYEENLRHVTILFKAMEIPLRARSAIKSQQAIAAKTADAVKERKAPATQSSIVYRPHRERDAKTVARTLGQVTERVPRGDSSRGETLEGSFPASQQAFAAPKPKVNRSRADHMRRESEEEGESQWEPKASSTEGVPQATEKERRGGLPHRVDNEQDAADREYPPSELSEAASATAAAIGDCLRRIQSSICPNDICSPVDNQRSTFDAVKDLLFKVMATYIDECR
ncbi:hypothetical protein BESB_038110 [Besnoitia besnoiti]|uniref:Uncharacterized protein n=1 Tax=Besnoitia besnoiti TaxID=94643 RepID=A0A2A9MNA9_BESBE|nr:hypothetical protein BESB_038110 [Besnoitia besnoiti]PFH37353.1 hypothetical protein BESB_038110 [Besnoitia besnoiti]